MTFASLRTNDPAATLDRTWLPCSGCRTECARFIDRFGLASCRWAGCLRRPWPGLARGILTFEEETEHFTTFLHEFLKFEDGFVDLEELEETEEEGKWQFGLLLRDNCMRMHYQLVDGLIQFDFLDLHTDIMFMFLALSHNFFDQILVVPQKERQSLLQPCDVVHGVDKLVVAIVHGDVPETGTGRGGRGLEGLVEEGGRQAFLEEPGDEEMQEVDVLQEVLIDFGEVLYFSVDVSHQEIHIEIVLPP